MGDSTSSLCPSTTASHLYAKSDGWVWMWAEEMNGVTITFLQILFFSFYWTQNFNLTFPCCASPHSVTHCCHHRHRWWHLHWRACHYQTLHQLCQFIVNKMPGDVILWKHHPCWDESYLLSLNFMIKHTPTSQITAVVTKELWYWLTFVSYSIFFRLLIINWTTRTR